MFDNDSRVFGTAAGIIFVFGMGVGMSLMSAYHGETIKKQKQYCLSQCEKFAKDKGELIECTYGCKEAAEHIEGK